MKACTRTSASDFGKMGHIFGAILGNSHCQSVQPFNIKSKTKVCWQITVTAAAPCPDYCSRVLLFRSDCKWRRRGSMMSLIYSLGFRERERRRRKDLLWKLEPKRHWSVEEAFSCFMLFFLFTEFNRSWKAVWLAFLYEMHYTKSCLQTVNIAFKHPHKLDFFIWIDGGDFHQKLSYNI